MTTCARCGLPKGTMLQAVGGQACSDGDMSALGDDGESTIACRDRQIAAQAALLRSVTGKLEDARALIEDDASPDEAALARQLLDSVLEVLS